MAITSTSYKPGQSGNLNGRPKKGFSITETFREMFEAEPELKQKLATKILSRAMAGDMSACKLIWSYLDGQPPQNQQLEVEAKIPIPIFGGLSVKSLELQNPE